MRTRIKLNSLDAALCLTMPIWDVRSCEICPSVFLQQMFIKFQLLANITQIERYSMRPKK